MIRHYVLTMTTAANRLSEVLPNGAGSATYDRSIRAATLQAFGTNASPVYVGGYESGVPTSSVYGQRIEAATGGIPPAPTPLMGVFEKGSTKLSDFYVLGANTEKLTVLVDFY